MFGIKTLVPLSHHPLSHHPHQPAAMLHRVLQAPTLLPSRGSAVPGHCHLRSRGWAIAASGRKPAGRERSVLGLGEMAVIGYQQTSPTWSAINHQVFPCPHRGCGSARNAGEFAQNPGRGACLSAAASGPRMGRLRRLRVTQTIGAESSSGVFPRWPLGGGLGSAGPVLGHQHVTSSPW